MYIYTDNPYYINTGMREVYKGEGPVKTNSGPKKGVPTAGQLKAMAKADQDLMFASMNPMSDVYTGKKLVEVDNTGIPGEVPPTVTLLTEEEFNGGSLQDNPETSPVNVDLDMLWDNNVKIGNNRKMNRANMEMLDNYFIEQGVPLPQRQALLYTILQESGADALGAHGNGYYGLVGWSGPRYNVIKDKSLMGQAAHLYNTLYNGTGKSDWNDGGKGSGYKSWADARKAFIEATDFDTAMRALTYGYVRPSDENKVYRIKYGPKHFAFGGPVKKYDSKLPKGKERAYAEWVASLPLNLRSDYDYDLRGAFLAGEKPDKYGHMTDKYKKPWHPTFSDESVYSTPEAPGGHWEGDKFVPSALNKFVSDFKYGNWGANNFAKGGPIHIKKENRGKFTAAADRAGKSVQAYASQVLANKENYSPTMVKRANFARNAAKWHGGGGIIDINDRNKMYDSIRLDPKFQALCRGGRMFAAGGSPEDPPKRYPISLSPSEFFGYYGFNDNNRGNNVAYYEPRGAYGSYLGPYRLPEVVVTPKERELIEDISFDKPATTLPDYLGDRFTAYDLVPFGRVAYNMGSDLADNGLKNQMAYLRDYMNDPLGLPVDLAAAVVPGGGWVTTRTAAPIIRTGARATSGVIENTARNAGKGMTKRKVILDSSKRKGRSIVRDEVANNTAQVADEVINDAPQVAQETLDFAHRVVKKYAEEHPRWAAKMAKKGVDLDWLYDTSKHKHWKALDLIIPRKKSKAMTSIAKRTAKREAKFADDFEKAYKRASKAYGWNQAIAGTIDLGALGTLGTEIGIPIKYGIESNKIQKNLEASRDIDSGYTEKELELFNALEKNNRELVNPDSTKRARDSVYRSLYENYYEK